MTNNKFMEIAKSCKTEEELINRIKAEGGDPYFHNGEIWNIEYDRFFGDIAASALLTENGFKVTIY